MATLDIRDENSDDITEIRWGENSCDVLTPGDAGSAPGILLGIDYIYFCQIDDLIKALQKARELWGPK